MTAHKQPRDHVVRSAIVTAFTIAVALIWKDVITAAIEMLIPARDELYAQFLAALGATILIILAIKLFVSADEKAEKVVDHILENHNRHLHEQQDPKTDMN